MSQNRYPLEITPRKTASIDMKIQRASAQDKKFNPGRRVEIRYQDLGLQEATNGELRAEVMHIGNVGESRPTGWHYHTADVQFLHVIKGWVRMEFPELGVVVLEEGDSITIPGGTVHQELAASNPVELLELTMPGKISTVNVAPPEWAKEKAENYGDISKPLQ